MLFTALTPAKEACWWGAQNAHQLAKEFERLGYFVIDPSEGSPASQPPTHACSAENPHPEKPVLDSIVHSFMLSLLRTV